MNIGLLMAVVAAEAAAAAPGKLSPAVSKEMTESTGSSLQQDTMVKYPHLVEIAEHAMRSDYSVDKEFDYGLDLILEALERTAASAPH